jgi:two-component system response regulator
MKGEHTPMDGDRPIVLMADDDEDDCMLAEDALNQIEAGCSFCCVEDGIDLMNYLHRSGEYAREANKPLPALILLDLNMPRKSGQQALKEIKSESAFQNIPVVVLTTSGEEKVFAVCREMGAVSLITKPTLFADWVAIMKSLVKSWMDTNE